MNVLQVSSLTSTVRPGLLALVSALVAVSNVPFHLLSQSLGLGARLCSGVNGMFLQLRQTYCRLGM